MPPLKDVPTLLQITETFVSNQTFTFLESHITKCTECNRKQIPKQLCQDLITFKNEILGYIPSEDIIENILNQHILGESLDLDLHRLFSLFWLNGKFKKYVLRHDSDFELIGIAAGKQLTELRSVYIYVAEFTNFNSIKTVTNTKTINLVDYLRISTCLKILNLNGHQLNTNLFLEGISQNCNVIEEILSVRLRDPVTETQAKKFCFKNQQKKEMNPCCETLKVLDIDLYWKANRDVAIIRIFMINIPNLRSLGLRLEIQEVLFLLEKFPEFADLENTFNKYCAKTYEVCFSRTRRDWKMDIQKFPMLTNLSIVVSSEFPNYVNNFFSGENYNMITELHIRALQNVDISLFPKSLPNLQSLEMNLEYFAQVTCDQNTTCNFKKLRKYVMMQFDNHPNNYGWLSLLSPKVETLRIYVIESSNELPDGSIPVAEILKKEFPNLQSLTVAGFKLTEGDIRNLIYHLPKVELLEYTFDGRSNSDLHEELWSNNLNIEFYDISIDKLRWSHFLDSFFGRLAD